MLHILSTHPWGRDYWKAHMKTVLIVELKVVDEIIPLYISQLLTYLRFSDQRLGLIINFNTRFFCDSVKRVIR
jgi:GxxExxY protein